MIPVREDSEVAIILQYLDGFYMGKSNPKEHDLYRDTPDLWKAHGNGNLETPIYTLKPPVIVVLNQLSKLFGNHLDDHPHIPYINPKLVNKSK